jgi:hypothetical protein
VYRESWDHKDSKAFKDFRGYRDLVGQLAHRDSKVFKAYRDHRDYKVFKA